jgi:hypothetical protein
MDKQVSLDCSLKTYVNFLVQKHLEGFARDVYLKAKEINLPVLQFYAHLTEKELIEFNKVSMLEFLDSINRGTVLEDFKHKAKLWKSDQHQIPSHPMDLLQRTLL